MWKNSLNNVESDNNKILYETLLDFVYNETVLTVWISLVHTCAYIHILFYFCKSFKGAVGISVLCSVDSHGKPQVRYCIDFVREGSVIILENWEVPHKFNVPPETSIPHLPLVQVRVIL